MLKCSTEVLVIRVAFFAMHCAHISHLPTLAIATGMDPGGL